MFLPTVLGCDGLTLALGGVRCLSGQGTLAPMLRSGREKAQEASILASIVRRGKHSLRCELESARMEAE